MIEQETHKQIHNGDLHAQQVIKQAKEETKPQSQQILLKSQHEKDEQLGSQHSKSSKSDKNADSALDLGKQINKLINIYSGGQSEDKLTIDQFKQLAQDLYSLVEPRQLTKEELDNLVNLFDQKQKDSKKPQAYKPPKTFITKEQLKKKVIENKGSLGFFKKK